MVVGYSNKWRLRIKIWLKWDEAKRFQGFRCREVETMNKEKKNETQRTKFVFVCVTRPFSLFYVQFFWLHFWLVEPMRGHRPAQLHVWCPLFLLSASFFAFVSNEQIGFEQNERARLATSRLKHFTFYVLIFFASWAQCRAPSDWPRFKRQTHSNVQTFNLTQRSVECVKSSCVPIDFIMLPILWPSFRCTWHVPNGVRILFLRFTHFDWGSFIWRSFLHLLCFAVFGQFAFFLPEMVLFHFSLVEPNSYAIRHKLK